MRIISILSLVLVVSISLLACSKPPAEEAELDAAVCGNSILEEGEDGSTCCQDAGCVGEQICEGSSCKEPECGECQYPDPATHACKDHACCENSDCASTEECKDHACVALNCGYCKYAEDHKCIAMACCDDEDCDDDYSMTKDICKNPSTKSAQCINEDLNECAKDADCDDSDASTEDTCTSSMPRKCLHMEISDCIDEDFYCPEGCNYKNDEDCSEDEIECTTLACFKDALEDCVYADFTWAVDTEDSENKITTTNYLRIKDEEDDECEVFIRTEEVKLRFTGDYKDELEDDGYSDDEIDDMEEDAEDDAKDVEDYTLTCFFEDTDEFADILDDWDDGEYDIDDIESYCEGDYFD